MVMSLSFVELSGLCMFPTDWFSDGTSRVLTALSSLNVGSRHCSSYPVDFAVG